MITYIENSLGHKTRWDTDFGLLPQRIGPKYAPDDDDDDDIDDKNVNDDVDDNAFFEYSLWKPNFSISFH